MTQKSLSVGLKPRDYLIEEYTRTVCPGCFADRKRRSDESDVFKDGMLISRDEKIWLRRFCNEHGETESLYEEDAEIWRARAGWSTPTLLITPDRDDNFAGFPQGYQNGLPASHGQHTCILLLNITDRCNYGCTTCYASAKAPDANMPVDEKPTIDEIINTVSTVIERENGKLGVLMLSGGEPTVRPDLIEIITRLLDFNITRIMINTNGRRVAKDDAFLEFLAQNKNRVEVYLQFDGLRSATSMELRAEDVVAEKKLALQRLNDVGVFTTLVTTVRKGVNEDEVGDLLMLGLSTPHCSGMAIQPVFGSGRIPPYDPKDRATPTGVLRRLGAQTNGLIEASDFIPLPCSHKDCCDITYLIKTEDGSWKSIPKLLGKEQLKLWIHTISNTISFQTLPPPVVEMVRSGSLQRLFSEQLKVGTTDIVRDIVRMCDCVPGLSDAMGEDWQTACSSEVSARQAAERTFRITCKMFMDVHTFHEARIRQCCVHTGTFEEDPRRYSFCWRWLFADADDFPDRAIPVTIERSKN